MNDILHKFRAKENFQVSNVDISEAEITELERRLGVLFTPQYRDFLKRYGYMACFGPCIFGICKTDFSDYFSVEKWTNKARTERLPKEFAARPKNGVVVCDYGGGGYYFLICSGNESGKVILVLDELKGRRATEFWDSFNEFVASLSLNMDSLPERAASG